MQTIGIILTFIVAIEHIGICFLEIFGSPEMQAKAFDILLSKRLHIFQWLIKVFTTACLDF